jgi:pSer/pThr/pTyr-binding forkhead associated (FHA) protein
MARLRITVPGAATTEVELSGTLTIGRHPAMELQLLDRLVSKQHLYIEERPDGFYVQDSGSRTGTYLNQSLLRERRRLESGDTLVVGETTIVFLEDDPGE